MLGPLGRRVCTLTLLVLALGLAACVAQQGQPRAFAPAELLARADDMAQRGDVIAAHHLAMRLRSQRPGSYFGVLATLRRRAALPRGDETSLGPLVFPPIEERCAP